MVCTYKLFTGDKIWRRHTRERAPLWCTALIRTHANEQFLIPSVLVQYITRYITTYPVIVYSTLDCQYIWISMGGLIFTYKVELITRLDCD